MRHTTILINQGKAINLIFDVNVQI